jgi:hypothetical protein
MPAPNPKYLDERGRIIAPGIDRPNDMTPVAVKLPSIASLSSLTDSELLAVAQRYGVYAPWRDMFAANAKYVEQFSKIPVGSDRFWQEVNRITLPEESSRAALGLARGAQRNYNQLLATDGDESRVLARVGEGDDAMCDGCIEREGAEGTMAEHEAIGLPGTQECGGNCRCVLIPVDDPPAKQTQGEDEGSWLLTGIIAAGIISAILEGDE